MWRAVNARSAMHACRVVRRPCGEMQYLEGFDGPATIVSLREPALRRFERSAGERRTIAAFENIGRTHGAEVADQLPKAAVRHLHPIDIDHRHGEAGTCQ